MTELTKYIELPFKVIASYEPPESAVGYPGGVTIEDVELDGQSVFTGDIQSVIEQRIRELEGEMQEEVAEQVRDEAEAMEDKIFEDHCNMRNFKSWRPAQERRSA